MRIQGKRARYAAELAAPAEGKRVGRFVDAARELQDVLGEHQDAVVAVRQLRELARVADRTDTALVAGRLIEREEERKKAAPPRCGRSLDARPPDRQARLVVRPLPSCNTE